MNLPRSSDQGYSVTTGGSLTFVTVNVAGSSSHNPPGSVALNVIVSEPYQSALGIVIVATRFTILTVSCEFPEVRPGHLRIRIVCI